MTSKNKRAPLLYYIKLCVSFQIHPWIQTEVTLRKRSIQVKIGDFFVPCDLEIWRITLQNNRAPLLCYFKLCAAFRSHWWIQIGVTVRKHPILHQALCIISNPSVNLNWSYTPEKLNSGRLGDFLSLVTLKFDGWPWKTIGHLFYTTSSFVHHFKSIGELKLKLPSRNAQFGSKSSIFCPVWPWNLTDALKKQ